MSAHATADRAARDGSVLGAAIAAVSDDSLFLRHTIALAFATYSRIAAPNASSAHSERTPPIVRNAPRAPTARASAAIAKSRATAAVSESRST